MIKKLKNKYLLLSAFLLIALNFYIFSYQSNTFKLANSIDFNQLIHLNSNDYKFTLNPGYSICGNNASKKLLLIAVVIISPDFFEQRELIRQTWGSLANFEKNFKLIFSIGLSKDKSVNERVKQEFIIHNDIIQKNFVDSYFNLTFKVMESFKWVHEFCSNSHYTLRINDDVVVNTYRLLEYVNELKETANNQLVGLKYVGSKPIRDPESKFYVSFNVFNQSYYDDYCEGSAYLIRTDLTKKIYDYSLGFRYKPFSVWLEDVYVGMIAKRMGIGLTDVTWRFVPINQYWNMPSWLKYVLIGEKTLFVYERDYMSFIWNKFLSIRRDS